MATLFRSDGWVKTAIGPAVPGAQIFVCTQPANVTSTLTPFPPSPLASIFADANGVVPITQPIITDGFGHYDFYVAGGVYTLLVYLNGVLQQNYPDQSVGGVGSGGNTFYTAGAGISIVGSVISSTVVGPTFQTNGVTNSVQGLLNLKNGTNLTVVYDGAGGIAFNYSPTGASIGVPAESAPSAVNLSTAATDDWMAPTSTGISGNGINYIDTFLRKQGSYIAHTYSWFGQTGGSVTPTSTGTWNGAVNINSNAGDGEGQVNLTDLALVNSQTTFYAALGAIVQNWGLSFRVRASNTVSRTLNILLGASGCKMHITTSYSDGSVAPVSTVFDKTAVSANGPMKLYQIVFQAGNPNTDLIVKILCDTVTSSANGRLAFQAIWV